MIDEEIAAAAKEAAEEAGLVEEKPAVPETGTTEPEKGTDEAQATEVKAEEKAEEKPTEEKPATEEEPEDFGLSAEQLEKLTSTDEGRALYKSMQRGFTKKTQALAEKSKSIDGDKSLVEFINKDPEKALEILAERTGRKVIKPETAEIKTKEDVVDELMEKWTKALGNDEAAKAFLPLLRETIETEAGKKISPVLQTQEEIQKAAEAQQVAAAVAQFGANRTEKGQEWTDDVQAEMAVKMSKMQPGEDTPIGEYLDSLYSAVMWDRAQSGKTKAALKRLQDAQETEPVGGSRPTETTAPSITKDMKIDDAIEAAVALAQQEIK